MRFLTLALAAAACAFPAAGAGAQDVLACTSGGDPVPDLAGASEAELRALAIDPCRVSTRAPAIAELRRRFPMPATLAFAGNAEARAALDADRPDRALALYRRVFATYGGNADPAVEIEAARAMVGQMAALDLAEALRDKGPLRPLRPSDIDMDDAGNRLRRALVARYGGRTDPQMRAIIGQERYNLLVSESIAAGRLGDAPRLRALAADYRDSDHPALRELVARILADAAFNEPDIERRIAEYAEIVRLFADTPTASLRHHVAGAYESRSFHLEELGRREEAARVTAEYLAWLERFDPGGMAPEMH